MAVVALEWLYISIFHIRVVILVSIQRFGVNNPLSSGRLSPGNQITYKSIMAYKMAAR